MDDDKMSCGQEDSDSSGEAPIQSGAAIGNFPEESRSEIPVISRKNHAVNSRHIQDECCAPGNFPEESRSEIPVISRKNHAVNSRHIQDECCAPGNFPEESRSEIPVISQKNHAVNSRHIQDECCAPGNFPEESRSEIPVISRKNHAVNSRHIQDECCAPGNFPEESPDFREETCYAPGIFKTQADVEESHRELPASCAQADVKGSCRALPASSTERNVKVSCCALGIFKTQADVEESCNELPASYAEADVKVSCCGLGIFKKQSVRHFTTQSVTTPVSSPVSLPTIYKVPKRIRQRNKDEYEPYEPQIVSIGPYHHRKKKEFEEHKKEYQQSILLRNPKHVLDDYHTAIAKLETKARSCYSEHVGLDCNEFVKMMMLDGCFIVELFLRIKEKRKDPIFRTIWMLPLIRYDMLLLENQIPFFVLEIIYEMASLGNGSLVKLALDFFERIIPMNEENKIEVSKDLINGHYFHLLHLFHSYLMPTPREKSKKCKILMKGSNEAKLPIKNTTIKNPSRNTTIKMIPCAAELKLAGVKFKKKKDFSSFLDVKFSGGVLEIPYLCIDDNTNTLLRNLVALEQFCYPGVKTIHFTRYVGFMDCLVNTSKDVALLHREGIIDHLLGSDGHVADLFNQLCYGIFIDFEYHNYFSGIYKDVDKYYNTPWNTRRANLKSDYFTNPWASLSTAAAVILLLLTFLQTFYTIFAYHRPGS